MNKTTTLLILVGVIIFRYGAVHSNPVVEKKSSDNELVHLEARDEELFNILAGLMISLFAGSVWGLAAANGEKIAERGVLEYDTLSTRHAEAGAANVNELLMELAVLQTVKQLASEERKDHPSEDNVSPKESEKVSKQINEEEKRIGEQALKLLKEKGFKGRKRI